MITTKFMELLMDDKKRKEEALGTLLGMFIQGIISEEYKNKDIDLVCEQAKFYDNNQSFLADYLLIDKKNNKYIIVELKDKDVSKKRELNELKRQFLRYKKLLSSPAKYFESFIKGVQIYSSKWNDRKYSREKYINLNEKINELKLDKLSINDADLIYILPEKLRNKLSFLTEDFKNCTALTYRDLYAFKDICFEDSKTEKIWQQVLPYLIAIDSENKVKTDIDLDLYLKYIEYVNYKKNYPNNRIADSVMFAILPFLEELSYKLIGERYNMIDLEVREKMEIKVKKVNNKTVLFKFIPSNRISNKAKYRLKKHLKLESIEYFYKYDAVIYITSEDVKKEIQKENIENGFNVYSFNDLSDLRFISNDYKVIWNSIVNTFK